MTVPAHPLSKAQGSMPVDQSISNVGTTEALGRQPKVVSQIKPHEFADSPKRVAQFFCPSGTNSVVKQMVPASRTQ
jgi:hypothetical protein